MTEFPCTSPDERPAAALPAANAPPAPEAESTSERIARQLKALREIGERALALAHQAADDADAIANDPPPIPGEKPARRRGPDPRIVFDRMARIVREAITLERRILLEQTPDLPRLAALQSRLTAPGSGHAYRHPPAPLAASQHGNPGTSPPPQPPQSPTAVSQPPLPPSQAHSQLQPRLNRHERRIMEKRQRSA